MADGWGASVLMHKVDILVVGAGVAGVGVAQALCKLTSTKQKLVILEKEAHPGYHSTGRSAATWIESYGNACIRELNERSFDCFVPLIPTAKTRKQTNS